MHKYINQLTPICGAEKDCLGILRRWGFVGIFRKLSPANLGFAGKERVKLSPVTGGFAGTPHFLPGSLSV